MTDTNAVQKPTGDVKTPSTPESSAPGADPEVKIQLPGERGLPPGARG